jgi:hypothetical protein
MLSLDDVQRRPLPSCAMLPVSIAAIAAAISAVTRKATLIMSLRE